MIQFLDTIACGNLTDIPSKIPRLSSEIFLIIQIAVPVLLVIMGTIDMFNGITANNEDEIIKGRKLFVKRLVVGAIVFFIFAIVKMLVTFLDSKNSSNIVACMNCFLNNECKSETQMKIDKINEQRKEVQANYVEWTCVLNGQEFRYHSQNGSYALSPDLKGVTSYDSAFVPQNANECPTSDGYVIARDKTTFEVVSKNKANDYSWDCTLGNYTIKYNLAGDIKYYDKNMYFSEFSSEYKPEYIYACPDPVEYKATTGAAKTPSTYYFKVVKR